LFDMGDGEVRVKEEIDDEDGATPLREEGGGFELPETEDAEVPEVNIKDWKPDTQLSYKGETKIVTIVTNQKGESIRTDMDRFRNILSPARPHHRTLSRPSCTPIRPSILPSLLPLDVDGQLSVAHAPRLPCSRFPLLVHLARTLPFCPIAIPQCLTLCRPQLAPRGDIDPFIRPRPGKLEHARADQLDEAEAGEPNPLVPGGLTHTILRRRG
jgi:hypothetical protein